MNWMWKKRNVLRRGTAAALAAVILLPASMPAMAVDEEIPQEQQPIQVEEIQVYPDVVDGPITLDKMPVQMYATVLPENADNVEVVWSAAPVDEESTANVSIDESGLLTVDSTGDYLVTATAVDGSSVTGEYLLTVEEAVQTLAAESDDSAQAAEWDQGKEYMLLTVLKDAGIEVYGGSTSAGTTVDLWWNYAGDALYWRLIPDELGEYYRIQPKNATSTVLMPTDSSVAVGTALTLGEINEEDASQWWKIVPAGTEGQYQLLNKASETEGSTKAYIALEGDAVSDGTLVVLSDGTTVSSYWNLKEVEVAPPEPVDPVVNVFADQTMLEVGESTKIRVTALDEYEQTMAVTEVRSSNPEVATVEVSGGEYIVTAKANGVTSIVASAKLADQTVVEGYIPIIVGTEPVEGSIYELSAPDTAVSALLAYDASYGTVSYAALNDGAVVVSASPTGIVTNKGDFRSGLTFITTETTSGVEDYDLFGAKVKHVTAPYNEMTLQLEKDGVSYAVILRVLNDGVAFRYSIDGEADTALSISSEHTGLRLPDGAHTWAMNYSQSNEDVEYEYDSIQQLGGRYSMPLLYETDEGTFALVNEADLNGTYCGAQITGDGTGMLHIVFTPEQTTDVETVMPFQSPWRYVVIGDLQAITNNTVAESLCPDSKVEDTSWIEAGVMDWTWLNGDLRHDQLPAGVTFEEAGLEYYKEYIDFAVEMGWKYQLLDEGWQPKGDTAAGEHEYEGYYDWMPELIDYAAEKGVGLIVWVRKANITDDEYRQQLFQEWAAMGIKGIKPDFFDSQDQDTIALLEKIMEETAEYHLLLNVHGAGKPTGERRTWPQAIAREAVRGAEAYAVDDEDGWGAIMTAHHNCSLPFVRGAVGPMDYTPMVSYGANDNLWNQNPGRFTVAHMTALPVIYECGLQCLADKPDVYRAHPGYENYFMNMPSEWDESILIDGYPGDYVNMARRSGDVWYVGIICDAKRDATFSLDFLDDGEYTAYIYKDSPEVLADGPAAHDEFGRHDTDGSNLVVDEETVNSSIVEEIKVVTNADTLTIPLAETGGAAIKLVKSEEEPETPSGEITVTRYDVTVEEAENGTVKVSHTRPSYGLTVTVTLTPDDGYTADGITITDDKGNAVAVTDKGDGKYTFKMPRSNVTVAASFVKDEVPVETGLPFTDVAESDWFHDAVKYAYDNKLMDGTSESTFAPLMTTNRAMIVTILWRLAGSPEVDYTMNFGDVENDEWYAEAVCWAASEGIVTGYSDTVFAPNDTVTREQLATILYRYAESQEYEVSAKGDLTAFTDGEETSSWAVEAMEWAVGAKLLSGKGGSALDPTGTATRAEVAQILMRFMEGIM